MDVAVMKGSAFRPSSRNEGRQILPAKPADRDGSTYEEAPTCTVRRNTRRGSRIQVNCNPFWNCIKSVLIGILVL